jgi:hypothetical protein
LRDIAARTNSWFAIILVRRPIVTSSPEAKPASTELTGGAGFTYEDTVVAYYLVHLLRREGAAGQAGTVTSIAVQQQGHGQPMDDLVVTCDDAGKARSLGLQIKRSFTISGTESNEEFRGIVAAAAKTQALPTFAKDTDKCGFIVEHVTDATLRTLTRLIDWAKASPAGSDFEARFLPSGNAGKDESALRAGLLPVIGAASGDDEAAFYRHLAALHLSGFEEGGALRAEIVNRLQELVASNQDGQDVLLFDRLCRIAREGAAVAAKWTRASLLAQLRGAVRLKVTANLSEDIGRLNTASHDALNDVSETVDDFHVSRETAQAEVHQKLGKHRVVSIGGLPGCGKSAVLKRFAAQAAANGPILFLKNDRLQGTSWLTFTTALGLRHGNAVDLLIEIGATGTPVLFIDGIDRIRPDQQHIITDLLHAIDSEPGLANWKVLASSRDQGLEAYRAWFPPKFYVATGMGDVSVKGFSEEEAEQLAKSKPNLRKLLMSPSAAVRDIARRPFFAAVLAKALPQGAEPQTEVDLINAWWARAGHDAIADSVPQRQRALIDLAEKGVRNLGKGVPARDLQPNTVEHLAALKADHILRDERGGAIWSFTHDIFFEWAFFRLLIELGENWISALSAAGEPPLLGRVVGLLAQDAVADTGRWTAGYAQLEQANLRSQWRRDWLTAPPFTHAFEGAIKEFTDLAQANDFALCEKLLVWFQAQHTVPSPLILQGAHKLVEGVDPVRMADLLGWPSDGVAWGRFIDWIIDLGPALPARLVQQAVEVFGVWQNALADFKNARSKRLLELCSAWLIDLEKGIYAEGWPKDRGMWDDLGSEAEKSLASALRNMLLRSARSFPEYAVALFERATTNDRMLDAAYEDLMGFTPFMAEVAPESVEKVAIAKLIEELPQDTEDRLRREHEEQSKWRAELRKIPKEKLTRQQEMALNSPPFFVGYQDFNLDQIGIESHNPYYHPPSPLHEPFASLLAKSPDVGLRLIRKLANHATTGWRQVHKLRRRDKMGTPIPMVLEFPWGKQEFWGDWHVYGWGQGMLGSQTLECAFLALGYWAFKEIEKGRSTSEVIKSVLEGSECYGALGLALCLALETHEVSEVTLPIVACQRLWEHDMARMVQESSKNLDLFGLGFLTRLTGVRAQAKAFLDGRKYRKREVRELAMLFALSGNEQLRERFKALLAAFPRDLPYQLEEERAVPAVTKALKEKAERWAGLGDAENYRQIPHQGDQVAIAYQPPQPLTKAEQKKLTQSTESLNQQRALYSAMQYLNEGKIADGWSMTEAIAFARKHDSKTMFDVLADVGPHAVQSAISATAACVIRYGAEESADLDWAWDVMSRILTMTAPGKFHGSKIPWHPALHLVIALFHDRKGKAPRPDSTSWLINLAVHALDDVQALAFQALLADPDAHVKWVAAQLAFDLAHYWHPIRNDETYEQDDTPGQNARAEALARALAALSNPAEEGFKPVPAAWVKASHKRRHEREDYWTGPDPAFDGQAAAKFFPLFPIEEWCQSDAYRPKLQALLVDLVKWTSERLMPPWQDGKSRQDKQTELFEWDRALGSMMARTVPFLELIWIRENLVTPFLANDEEALRVLAAFANNVVNRHVFDAPQVPENALPLLDDCVTRVIQDRTFRPKSHRAGEVHGYDMPDLVRTLLFMNVDKNCPGSARFANGDWSQISIIMPLVTKLVTSIGWSAFVMRNFLTLCERAADAYPIGAFTEQAGAVLGSIANAKGSWVGTMLPARIATIIQRLADANYPLQVTQARALLQLLDALIDLGDRRSAALEQTEAFRRVQGTAC